eukprot:gene11029-11184_t
MHRPLPVPLDMLQLPDLSALLNMDTWNNLLTEPEQQQLRQLLPNKGEGFSDQQLEALLAGRDNFHFGNPTAKMWQDCLS